MIGEMLYGLTNVDRGAQWLETYIRESNEGGLVTDIDFNFDLPKDRNLVLQAAAIRGLSGAAQTCTGLHIGIQRAASTVNEFFMRDEDTARAQLVRTWSWSGALYVRAGEKIVIYGKFSAGANSNNVRACIAGYTLPLGNVGAG